MVKDGNNTKSTMDSQYEFECNPYIYQDGKIKKDKKKISKKNVRVGKGRNAIIAFLLVSVGAVSFALSGIPNEIISEFNTKRVEMEASKDASIETSNSIVGFEEIPQESSKTLSNNTISDEDSIEEVEEHEVIDTSLYDNGYGFATYKSPDYLKKLNPDNSDSTSWLKIENSNISYPVVHPLESKFNSVEDANNYYLHHSITGLDDRNGTLFIDTRDSRIDKPTKDINDITYIYGHHMKNGKMFASLKNWMYDDGTYNSTHPRAIIYTSDGYGYEVEFIVGHTISGNSDEVLHIDNFKDSEEKEDFINSAISDAKSKGMFVNPNYEYDEDDKYCCFITCSYNEENERFALIGRATKIKTNDKNMENNNGYYVEESSTLSR